MANDSEICDEPAEGVSSQGNDRVGNVHIESGLSSLGSKSYFMINASKSIMEGNHFRQGDNIHKQYIKNYNSAQIPLELQRPAADFSPSERIRGRSIADHLKISKMSTGIGFISAVFTITGTNVFDFHHLIPDRCVFIFLACSIGFLFVGGKFFREYWLLKRKGYYETLGKLKYTGDDGALYIMLWRRTCPWCGGVMYPQKVMSSTDLNQIDEKWVCQENQRLHVLDYDPTEIRKALNDKKITL